VGGTNPATARRRGESPMAQHPPRKSKAVVLRQTPFLTIVPRPMEMERTRGIKFIFSLNFNRVPHYNLANKDFRWSGSKFVRRRGKEEMASKEVEGLIKTLRNKGEDWQVRAIAAATLGNIGDAKAVDPLIEALKDADDDVRERAAEALGKIGDAKAVDPLIEALKDASGEVRWRAARALVEIGDAKAVDPLIEALHDEYWLVRHYAAEGLGKFGDPKAIKPLIRAMKDEHWSVRHAQVTIAHALSNFEDSQVAKPVLQAIAEKVSAS
jgi:HEAT repeat protein